MKRLLDSGLLVNDLDFNGRTLRNPGKVTLQSNTKIAPFGLYYLWPTWQQGNAPDPTQCKGLTNPGINGILWRWTWERSAQTGPAPNFNYGDACISASDSNGKDCAFQIVAGYQSPPWIFAPPYNCPNFKSGTVQLPTSVPWDPVVQGLWQTYQTAMAARYKSHPHLKYVLIQGVGRASETFFAITDTEFAAASALAISMGYSDVHTAWKAGCMWYIDMMVSVWAPIPVVLTTGVPFSVANGGQEDLQAMYDYGDANHRGLFGARNNDLNHVNPNPGDFSYSVIQQLSPHCIATGSQFGNHQIANDPNPPQWLSDAFQILFSMGGHFAEMFSDDADPNPVTGYNPTPLMLATTAAMPGIEGTGFAVQSDDPRLSDKRTMLSGSITDFSVSPTAAIQQSKLNLNGVIPVAWLGSGPNQAAQGNLVQLASLKGGANGYAPLNASGTLDSSRLPTTGPGTGKVTFVGLAMPDLFSVPVNMVTTSGTLSTAWNNAPDQSWLGVFGLLSAGGSLTPAFQIEEVPLQLVPPLDGSIVVSGQFPVSQLPLMQGLGPNHAAGMVPDPGMKGDPSDYLARDASWKSVTVAIAYQPTVKGVQITLLSWYQGKAYIKIYCMQKNVSLFYLAQAVGPGTSVAAYLPTPNPITLLFIPGTHITAYAARAGYNNSPIASFIVPNSPTL